MSDPSIWSTPSGERTLQEGEIHLWRANLALEPDVLGRLKATLDNDEQARAERFHFSRDRDHYIASRGILRELLGVYLSSAPALLRFRYGPFGKPALNLEDSRPPIQFNLSHSHGLAVFAFATGREIGVDLESIRPEFAGEGIAERYFSTGELAELRALPAAKRAEGFFLCWTRKEAYIKARGLGLQIPLDSFSVSLTPGRPEILQSTDSDRWSLRSFEAAANYVGAIVGEGQEWRLHSWNWRDA